MNETRPQFVCVLEPTRDAMPESPTAEESRLVVEHFAYYCKKRDAGELIVAGRTLERPWMGLFVFEADSREAAEQVVAEDPGVKAGIFKARVQAYRVALIRT